MTFDDAFDRVISHEGGYVRNPKDPGGETQWGISKRAYPHLDIAALTREQAKAIYKRDYWDTLPPLPSPVKYQVFDFAVNSGRGTAIRALQRVIGAADDGVWGPESERLSKGVIDVGAYLAERLEFMTKLKGWPEFGKGWARRIAQNLRYAAHDR